jgi:hypothetical protein
MARNVARGTRAMLALACALLVVVPAVAADTPPSRVPSSRVPAPSVAIAAPGKCVEDTPFMLRNHMELLKHHRDKTVHDGIRTTRHSLANCVNCHAGKETGRVTGGKDAFCESCHKFAAVKLDCWDCHTDRAQVGLASGASK